jgi:hypothetical protein
LEAQNKTSLESFYLHSQNLPCTKVCQSCISQSDIPTDECLQSYRWARLDIIYVYFTYSSSKCAREILRKQQFIWSFHCPPSILPIYINGKPEEIK